MENKEELPGPVILDFEPTSCSMTVTRTGDRESPLPSSISMRLRLVEDDVRTPDDAKLTGAHWTMTFYDGRAGNQFTEAHNAIGVINYYAAYQSDDDDIDDSPESCSAWANLDSQTFALLRDMALAGKLPASLRVHAFGMNYGWEPDGRSKVWDVKAYPNAPIKTVEINAHLVRPPKPSQDVEEADPFWIEPASDSPELTAMRAVEKSIAQVNTRLGWVAGLLALAIAAMIFR